jgi:hypothetical protein
VVREQRGATRRSAGQQRRRPMDGTVGLHGLTTLALAVVGNRSAVLRDNRRDRRSTVLLTRVRW